MKYREMLSIEGNDQDFFQTRILFSTFEEILKHINLPPLDLTIKNGTLKCSFFDVELRICKTFICINEFIYTEMRSHKFYAEKIKGLV